MTWTLTTTRWFVRLLSHDPQPALASSTSVDTTWMNNYKRCWPLLSLINSFCAVKFCISQGNNCFHVRESSYYWSNLINKWKPGSMNEALIYFGTLLLPYTLSLVAHICKYETSGNVTVQQDVEQAPSAPTCGANIDSQNKPDISPIYCEMILKPLK